ncbi:MAG: hypothetical protein ABEJ66_00360, partial [Candidatus Nanohaloarchaea archaeon]
AAGGVLFATGTVDEPVERFIEDGEQYRGRAQKIQGELEQTQSDFRELKGILGGDEKGTATISLDEEDDTPEDNTIKVNGKVLQGYSTDMSDYGMRGNVVAPGI